MTYPLSSQSIIRERVPRYTLRHTLEPRMVRELPTIGLVPAVHRGNADPECNTICIHTREPDPALPGAVGAGDRDPGLG